MGRVRWRRWIAVIVGVLVVLAGSGIIAYRVFAPHEVLTLPTVPYPEVQVITDDRPFSELRAAPLVVEGRLRVYAETWRVWSDAPVGERYESTPYWTFRRWPAQVVGVVTAASDAGPMVVTQWSDGEIIALDARRGVLAWRDSGPIEQGRVYDGRRTGASVVYEPRSLLTARVATGTVIVVTGPKKMIAFDAATGRGLWRRDLPSDCEPMSWTSNGMVVVPDCASNTIRFYDVLSGGEKGRWTSPTTSTPSPGLCELARNECRLVTVGFDTWLIGGDATVTAVPQLERGAQLAGERVIYQTGIGVAARRLGDATPLWSWQGWGQLISADSAGVYLLTDDRTILELSPATGHLVAVGCASSEPNHDWKINHIYPTGSGTYLALERVSKAPVDPSDDQQYFYGPRPVALVELYPPTKLPVWSGKFANCARPV